METQKLFFLGILFFIIFIWLSIVTYRQNRLLKRGKELFSGSKKGDVYELINDYLVKVKHVEANNIRVKKNLEELIRLFQDSFQKMGTVRYNPLRDVGGNLSFSLALLDHNDNGIVITNIHSREGDRLYAKPVKLGKSEHNLSEEEKEALKKATNTNKQLMEGGEK